MKVSYFLNWMGPISRNWYKERGLVKSEGERFSKVLNKMIPNESITQEYATGRIDVCGLPLDEYYDGKCEYSVPLMTLESWGQLGLFLMNLKTEKLLSRDELFEKFEKEHGAINWLDKGLENG